MRGHGARAGGNRRTPQHFARRRPQRGATSCRIRRAVAPDDGSASRSSRALRRSRPSPRGRTPATRGRGTRPSDDISISKSAVERASVEQDGLLRQPLRRRALRQLNRVAAQRRVHCRAAPDRTRSAACAVMLARPPCSDAKSAVQTDRRAAIAAGDCSASRHRPSPLPTRRGMRAFRQPAWRNACSTVVRPVRPRSRAARRSRVEGRPVRRTGGVEHPFRRAPRDGRRARYRRDPSPQSTRASSRAKS